MMNKRQFLKTSSAAISNALLARYAGGDSANAAEPVAHETNWAGNLRYHADHMFAPHTVEEVQEVVKKCTSLRALGSRHSFNTIADSLNNQISLQHLDSMHLDDAAHALTVGAGVRYGTFAPWLDAKGFAVHNLASLPHITVAGAIATATHGSGVKNGNLSTAVRALEIVTADGEVHTITRDQNNFMGSVVGLGSLGVVTKVTLDVLPRFDMTQLVYRNLSMDQLEHNLEAIMACGYSVSLFTDWQDNRIAQVWIKEPRRLPVRRSTFPGILRRQGSHEKHASHRGQLRRKLHRADGRSRPLVRAHAALQNELHSLQRRRAADRILRPPQPRVRSHPRRRATQATRSRPICSSPNCAPSPPMSYG